jgi:ankyrin repeat protein
MRGGGGCCGLCVGAVQTDDGATPLYIASRNGHGEVAKLLLDRGTAVNQARV